SACPGSSPGKRRWVSPLGKSRAGAAGPATARNAGSSRVRIEASPTGVRTGVNDLRSAATGERALPRTLSGIPIRLKGAVAAGARSGTVLSVLAILFAILGLTPSLSWIPEAPLLTVAAVGPIFLLGRTGYRLGKDSWMAAIAGATAGAIGGCVGRLGFPAYGKSALNLVP